VRASRPWLGHVATDNIDVLRRLASSVSGLTSLLHSLVIAKRAVQFFNVCGWIASSSARDEEA
jgi:hypothetical protein